MKSVLEASAPPNAASMQTPTSRRTYSDTFRNAFVTLMQAMPRGQKGVFASIVSSSAHTWLSDAETYPTVSQPMNALLTERTIPLSVEQLAKVFNMAVLYLYADWTEEGVMPQLEAGEMCESAEEPPWELLEALAVRSNDSLLMHTVRDLRRRQHGTVHVQAVSDQFPHGHRLFWQACAALHATLGEPESELLLDVLGVSRQQLQRGKAAQTTQLSSHQAVAQLLQCTDAGLHPSQLQQVLRLYLASVMKGECAKQEDVQQTLRVECVNELYAVLLHEQTQADNRAYLVSTWFPEYGVHAASYEALLEQLQEDEALQRVVHRGVAQYRKEDRRSVAFASADMRLEAYPVIADAVSCLGPRSSWEELIDDIQCRAYAATKEYTTSRLGSTKGRQAIDPLVAQRLALSTELEEVNLHQAFADMQHAEETACRRVEGFVHSLAYLHSIRDGDTGIALSEDQQRAVHTVIETCDRHMAALCGDCNTQRATALCAIDKAMAALPAVVEQGAAIAISDTSLQGSKEGLLELAAAYKKSRDAYDAVRSVPRVAKKRKKTTQARNRAIVFSVLEQELHRRLRVPLPSNLSLQGTATQLADVWLQHQQYQQLLQSVSSAQLPWIMEYAEQVAGEYEELYFELIQIGIEAVQTCLQQAGLHADVFEEQCRSAVEEACDAHCKEERRRRYRERSLNATAEKWESGAGELVVDTRETAPDAEQNPLRDLLAPYVADLPEEDRVLVEALMFGHDIVLVAAELKLTSEDAVTRQQEVLRILRPQLEAAGFGMLNEEEMVA